MTENWRIISDTNILRVKEKFSTVGAYTGKTVQPKPKQSKFLLLKVKVTVFKLKTKESHLAQKSVWFRMTHTLGVGMLLNPLYS